MSNSTAEQRKPLVDLNDIDTRQEAMARCIGPLTTLTTLRTLEQCEHRSNPFSQKIGKDQSIYGIDYTHPYSTVNPIALVGQRYESEFPREPAQAIEAGLTAEQRYLFERYNHAYGVTKVGLPGSVHEAIRATYETADNFLLPAYIAACATDPPKDGVEMRHLYQATPFDAQAAHLRKPDFAQIQRSFSFTANGILSGTSQFTTRDVFQRVTRKLRQHGIEGDVLDPLGLHELCARKPSGEIALSFRVVKLLRLCIELDNKYAIFHEYADQENTLGGSRGCPASIMTVKVHEDDFSDEQWADLTETSNPVAKYDGSKQELTMLRNPITEVTQAFADTLIVMDETKKKATVPQS